VAPSAAVLLSAAMAIVLHVTTAPNGVKLDAERNSSFPADGDELAVRGGTARVKLWTLAEGR
jgi:hypothetical protein